MEWPDHLPSPLPAPNQGCRARLARGGGTGCRRRARLEGGRCARGRESGGFRARPQLLAWGRSGSISLAEPVWEGGSGGQGWARPGSPPLMPGCRPTQRRCGYLMSCLPLMAVAMGIAGHHTAPLAWSGRSRWPFVVESFVQNGCFRVGGACFTLAGAMGVGGAARLLLWGSRSQGSPPGPALPDWAGLACARWGVGGLSLPSTQEPGFFCLKCRRWTLVPIGRSSRGQCAD